MSLGTTSVNLDDYQFKVDENITKQYPNYDPATKGTLPLAKNVVGAINEFDKVLGATYNYTTNEITNLTTKDKSTVKTKYVMLCDNDILFNLLIIVEVVGIVCYFVGLMFLYVGSALVDNAFGLQEAVDKVKVGLAI